MFTTKVLLFVKQTAIIIVYPFIVFTIYKCYTSIMALRIYCKNYLVYSLIYDQGLLVSNVTKPEVVR